MPTLVGNPEVQALIAEAREVHFLESGETPEDQWYCVQCYGIWPCVAIRLADALAAATPKVVEETEWAVEGSVVGFSRVHRFPDRESCDRFIKNPPLWADVPDGEYKIVSRRPASPWQPLIPPQFPSTPTPNGEQS